MEVRSLCYILLFLIFCSTMESSQGGPVHLRTRRAEPEVIAPMTESDSPDVSEPTSTPAAPSTDTPSPELELSKSPAPPPGTPTPARSDPSPPPQNSPPMPPSQVPQAGPVPMPMPMPMPTQYYQQGAMYPQVVSAPQIQIIQPNPQAYQQQQESDRTTTEAPEEEQEKSPISAITSFLPMAPMVLESLSGSLGQIWQTSMPQIPALTSMNNIAQVLVSPIASVSTGILGNSLNNVDAILPGLHSFAPVTKTIPGMANLFNTALTHPQQFLVDPKHLSVDPLEKDEDNYNNNNNNGGNNNMMPMVLPNPDGKGYSVMFVNTNSGRNNNNNNNNHYNYNRRHKYNDDIEQVRPSNDFNVEKIMADSLHRLMGLGVFMGSCPLGTVRTTDGKCQSVLAVG